MNTPFEEGEGLLEAGEKTTRREFLKSTFAGAVGATLSGFGNPPSRLRPSTGELTPVAALPDDVTRHWLGSSFWGNRLQDWRLHEGRLECLRGEEGYEVRTVSLLTREIARGEAPGHLSVLAGPIEGVEHGGFCGFLIGVGGGELDYRAAALAQRGSGTGGGFLCTYEADGHARFREHTDEEAPLAFAELPAEKEVAEEKAIRPELGRPVRLRLDIEPQGQGRFTVRWGARDAASGRLLAQATRRDVQETELLGGILLVSSPPIEGKGTRWWFQDMRTGGEKVTEHPDRTLGPVVGTMHTVNEEVLKLSAQLVPVGADKPQQVALEYRPAGSSETWRRTTARLQPGYTALFRVDPWDASRDWDYRVVYPADVDEPFQYTGQIRRDPVDASELKIGLFSCVLTSARQLEASVGEPDLPMARWLGRYTHDNIYFPHNELRASAGAHEPDLLVFCGDQLYEHSPTRMPERENPALDYLYKWYLWMWAFRDMARDTPAVLLIDDHDVYHPNVWGEAGKKCPDDVPTPWNYGGYMGTADFVNLVQRTQCSHNPDPHDPTPVERDISVYYGAFRYGGIDFAVLEDRKFKTAPLHGEDLNVHEPALLGERQEAFLAEWAETGDEPRVCLTQTCFASVQTSPQGRPLIDFDSNGYPKLGRDRAIELLREAGALVLAGDQHLASVVRHGLDDYDDGIVQFTGPAGGSFWQRWFEPAETPPNDAGTPHTGDFKDAFGNKVRVLAVANPKISFREFRQHIEGRTQSVLDRQLKSEGYGLIRVDREQEVFQIECWPWDENPTTPNAEQFAGWPVEVPFSEVSGRS